MNIVVYQSNEVAFFRDPSEDADVLKMVNDQTGQWTEMMNKHRKEQWEMMKTHLSGQDDVSDPLTKILSLVMFQVVPRIFMVFPLVWSLSGMF